MRKGITITYNHGGAIEQLQVHEEAISTTLMTKRVEVISLIN